MSRGETVRSDRDPFQLLEKLGEGGFAVTWRARVLDGDLAEDLGAEEVALKVPLDKKKELVLRRELEMNAALHLRLRGLEAVNVVRYLGFAVQDGTIVMAMEYVRQGSLRRLIGGPDRRQPLAIEDAVRIAEGILAGLAVIHAEHVFHRDIKPENILMQGQTPKIADLGISRLLNTNDIAVTEAGTMLYMSPEILGPEGASFPSDLWSLGVTLYEMVTGRWPFGDHNTPFGVLSDLIRGRDFAPPSQLRREVPAELDTIIGQALEKSPSRRPTAAEMAEALRRLRRRLGRDDRIERELAAIRELVHGNERVQLAEQKLREIVTCYPTDARAHLALGEFYNRCQRFAEAVAAFSAGVANDPEEPMLHWGLALAYQQEGRRKEALCSLDRAEACGLEASLKRHAATLRRAIQVGA
ncbi:MAG: protein kinase [Deltaproteobacteria bacterium]|nr:protein kinase [Deltaproteobacteria bacterium]